MERFKLTTIESFILWGAITNFVQLGGVLGRPFSFDILGINLIVGPQTAKLYIKAQAQQIYTHFSGSLRQAWANNERLQDYLHHYPNRPSLSLVVYMFEVDKNLICTRNFFFFNFNWKN
jgi:hypothetical protein